MDASMGSAQVKAPLITVGILTLNREWAIGAVLKSLLVQTYPHDKIFVVIVDGGSTDHTVEIARQLLKEADLAGFEFVVKRSTIPEARNICVERTRGGALLFWDSDVLAHPTAVQRLVAAMESYDVVSAESTCVSISEPEEIGDLLGRLASQEAAAHECTAVPSVSMSCTLIKRNVFEKVRFDPELTFGEDADFSLKARLSGFKVGLCKGAVAVDVNVSKSRLSDIYVYSPMKILLRGLRKKAIAKVYTLDFKVNVFTVINFFITNKRYAFYLGYLLAALLTVLGTFFSSLPLALTLPFYVAAYFAFQVARRGLTGGCRAVAASIVVGVPLSVLMLYYSVRKPKCILELFI